MLSVIILTKNEEAMISQCINSCKKIADEIIVIDNNSTDQTLAIAAQHNVKIEHSTEPSFAKRRELGLHLSKGDWILYLDADERITEALAQEIQQITSDESDSHCGVYILNRKDFYFGEPRPVMSPMHRLFNKKNITGWKGDLHETPITTGESKALQNFALHFTHIDLNSMMTNTLRWSDKEALLRFNTNHPPVVWWRLIRVFFTGFYGSFVTQQGYKCGTAGWIEAMYQGFSLFVTYAKLWEMQNKERIASEYKKLDEPFR